jgi:phosphoesterase RecJ-like protein
MTEKFAKAKKIIDRAENIVLSTHDEPDLDGFGSMLALQSVLQNLGKNSIIFTTYPMPFIYRLFSYQPCIKNQINVQDFDLIIGLDYGHYERLEIVKHLSFLPDNLLTFDHHLIGDHLGFKIVDSESSSTSEIIYRFIEFLEATINQEIATYLLTGIFDDTGGLRHPNTSAQTLKIASDLLAKGASLQKIIKKYNHSALLENFSTLTQTFSQIQIDQETGLVFLIINRTFERLEIGLKEINISNLLSAIPEAKAALLLTEKSPGFWEGSLRAQKNREVDVAKIAQHFGGGGHKLAAGFCSTDNTENIINKIKQLLLIGF